MRGNPRVERSYLFRFVKGDLQRFSGDGEIDIGIAVSADSRVLGQIRDGLKGEAMDGGVVVCNGWGMRRQGNGKRRVEEGGERRLDGGVVVCKGWGMRRQGNGVGGVEEGEERRLDGVKMDAGGGDWMQRQRGRRWK